MGFAPIFRGAAVLIDGLFSDLQPTVQHYSWVSQDGKGKDTFNPARSGAGTPVQCAVDYTQKQRTRTDGRNINVVATLTFPRPMVIGPKDVFILPNGTTAPVLSTPNAPVDQATGQSFYVEVELGELA